MLGDSVTLALMQKSLDGTWQRQKSISNNIANHETPGYKSTQVFFEKALKEEMLKIHGEFSNSGMDKGESIRRIADSEITINKDLDTSIRLDENNVNIDIENINMAKAQIQYQYLTRGMSDVFSRLKYAINEGKR